MTKSPEEPGDDVANAGGLIEIVREPAIWRNRYHRYQVLIDDQVVGKLASGEIGRYTVEAGEHTVQMSAGARFLPERFTSRRRTVVVGPNDHVVFRCKAGGNSIDAMKIQNLWLRDYIHLTEPTRTQWPNA